MHRVLRITPVPALIAVLGCAVPLSAQEGAQRGCSAPQHRQFDFWVGEWDVVNAAGQPAGRNRITSELGGCVLREQWAGAGGSHGSSFNIYDAAADRWHQTWVDDNGLLLLLDGVVQADGSMVMEGERPARGGGTARHRITWTPRNAATVRQLWEVSSDDGSTWSVVFDGTYHRIE
jgi:hypothetical protein